ncbi:MAG TPA: tRNA 2-thiouridine(34) synthase MnmA [Candidatus Moranbacteria bacterium]|nr:MAG: tRNA-specific 2-thiouridylase MnmA [Candidatus Moranbacteria bacterium GW2011_GWF1_34_10]HBI16597.1 tRNA 2-thiouridine(34) synthase MnmA [Candidatus Moranbacteria bacterium]
MSEKNLKLKKQRVLVGMSGGVDSSVAALLLQKEGYKVEGAFLDFTGGEKGERDFASAQKIARKLSIQIYKVDAQETFRKKIVNKFVSDYKKGITPNPCVLCNPQMKFKLLIEEANRRGIERVATGHYARVGREFPISNFQFPNKSQMTNSKSETKSSHQSAVISHQLFVAKDLNKDQSYFLYRLTQKQLERIIFPLGGYLKTQVREIAQENNFEIKNEEESQDVCFINDNDFNRFISEKIPNKPGKIVDSDGKVLGKHNGLHFYTIGQRKGINLGGDGPYFVVKKDMINNELVVANNPVESLWRDEFEINDVNWIESDLQFPLAARVRIRYRTEEIHAIIEELNAKKDKNYRIKLDQPQKAITPGQSAVFYFDSGEVLGGGIIL